MLTETEVKLIKDMLYNLETIGWEDCNVINTLISRESNSSSDEFTELCCDVLDCTFVWTLLDSALQNK